MNKTLFLQKIILSSLIIFTVAPEVYAQDASAGTSIYDMVFGNPNQRKATRERNDSNDVGAESCDGYGGILGVINGFFCHMEKDMGITGVGSATKTFADTGGNMSVRAEVTLTSTTINSVTYSYLAKVWVCSASCTSTSSFSRAFYLAFSYDTAAGVNKGYGLVSPGSFNSNQTGSAMEIEYDIGSSTATQFVRGKAIFVNNGNTFKTRILGEKSSTSLKVSVAMHNGTNGYRFAMSTTPGFSDSKYMNMYYEGSGGAGSNGFYSLDAAGTNGIGTAATGNGLCTSGVESGTSMSTSSVAASNCSALSFLAFDYASANTSAAGGAYLNSGSFTAAGILGTWQSMTVNPTSI